MADAIFEPLIVSAPFGNYIQPPGTTPTLGTFTAARRRGRVGQVLRTLRFYPSLGAWVNRIGLRNPGIAWLVDRVDRGKIDPSNKVISIHGFTAEDWTTLLEQVTRVSPLALELNMSCPNVGEMDWPPSLFEEALQTGLPILVKLPPIHYELMARQAVAQGISIFHCCNTLPVRDGGMSGAPLMPWSLACLQALRRRWAGQLSLIGGGGITAPRHIDAHVDAGADHVAIGTKTINPRLLWTYKPLEPLIDHARTRLRRST